LYGTAKYGNVKIVKYLLGNGGNKSKLKQTKFRINKRYIESNEYELIDNFKKGNEKWYDLAIDIWFYILNEFFNSGYEKTNQLLRLSQVSKYFYNELLSSEIIMNNFTFSIKYGINLINIVKEIKPSYKIRNLSLIYIKNEIKNDDLIHLMNEDYFNLYQLDISFCKFINDISFDYFSNIKVLEMVICDRNEISNNGLSKLKQLRELNMISCDQNSINNELFKLIGSNLKKLDISCCYQFTNEIFNYLPSNCKIVMNKLNLKRDQY
jgi:hypothetical protein